MFRCLLPPTPRLLALSPCISSFAQISLATTLSTTSSTSGTYDAVGDGSGGSSSSVPTAPAATPSLFDEAGGVSFGQSWATGTSHATMHSFSEPTTMWSPWLSSSAIAAPPPPTAQQHAEVLAYEPPPPITAYPALPPQAAAAAPPPQSQQLQQQQQQQQHQQQQQQQAGMAGAAVAPPAHVYPPAIAPPSTYPPNSGVTAGVPVGVPMSAPSASAARLGRPGDFPPLDVALPRLSDLPGVPVWTSDPGYHGPDSNVTCNGCRSEFSMFKRRHHCRNCGGLVCSSCSAEPWPATMLPPACNRKEKSSLHVCLKCNAAMVAFKTALQKGDMAAVLQVCRVW